MYSGKARRLLMILAVLTLCAVMLPGCSDPLKTEEPVEQIPTIAQTQQEGMRKTILHYALDSGLLVPVVQSIPWVEDIAQSALEHMQEGSPALALLEDEGLRPAIPEGVRYSVQVGDNSVAYVDLRGVSAIPDARAEQTMIQAISATLLEFPAVNEVCFTIDGLAAKQLPHGTLINQAIATMSLNSQGGEGAYPVVAYFTSAEGLLVPVTRMADKAPTLQSALNELYKTPPEGSGLAAVLPDSLKGLEADIIEETAVINFPAEAAPVFETNARALRAVILTCLQFEDVVDVTVKVGGEEWLQPTGEDGSVLPTFANEL